MFVVVKHARPAPMIIGTGTMLDTTRIRTLPAKHYQVDHRSVHALTQGEHGDPEIAAWSRTDIGGTPIRGNTILGKSSTPEFLEALLKQVRRAADEIIERKGYTNWTIGLVIAHLIRTIQEDQGGVLPVTVRLHGEYVINSVCIGIPVWVGIEGAGERVVLPLDDNEQRTLAASAETLKASLSSLSL